MEWIVGIYLAIGLLKGLGKLSADPTDKPIWMYSQKNPLIWSLCFLVPNRMSFDRSCKDFSA